VAILDADKEGFLRSNTSLVQTCGRAARNAGGRVIMYADARTESMNAAIGEMTRRRAAQEQYNTAHGIVPQTILKPVRDSLEALYEMDYVEVAELPERGSKRKSRGPADPARDWPVERLRGEIARVREDMLHAAEELRFEDAARLRDRLQELEQLELAR
jgi:excinuclease ABC subunit B